MNIERYKWPVIVAASLHGALLLSTPDRTRMVHTPPVKVDPGPTPPPIQVDMRDPAELPASGGEPSGAPNPLPRQLDVPMPADLHQIITIATVDRASPDKPVTNLKDFTTGPAGPGDGPATFGPPRMPTTLDLDRIPRAMAQPAPDYPYSLRQAGIAGSVTIEFIVGTDGHVMSAEAVKWTHREFAEPAVRAVLRWKFEPGTINGHKVRFRMAVPIEFNASS